MDAVSAIGTPSPEEKARYEAARKELQQALLKKRHIDRQLAQLEVQIYNFEGSYLSETAQHSGGNIIQGFDGYLKTQSVGRRRHDPTDADRVFSNSSMTYQKSLELLGETDDDPDSIYGPNSNINNINNNNGTLAFSAPGTNITNTLSASRTSSTPGLLSSSNFGSGLSMGGMGMGMGMGGGGGGGMGMGMGMGGGGGGGGAGNLTSIVLPPPSTSTPSTRTPQELSAAAQKKARDKEYQRRKRATAAREKAAAAAAAAAAGGGGGAGGAHSQHGQGREQRQGSMMMEDEGSGDASSSTSRGRVSKKPRQADDD